MTQDKMLQLPTGKLRLDSIAQLISHQTSFRFSINSSKVNASTLIDIPSGKISLEKLLNKLKQKFGVPYSIVGNHIIFSDHLSNLQPAKPKKTVVTQKKQVITKPSRIAATTPMLAKINLPLNTNLSIINRRIRPLRRQDVQQNTTPVNTREFRPLGLYAHAGLTVDDVMYTNVSAAFGKSWLYATGSWGTRYSLEGFRYGIGSGIDLTDDWLLRIELTTGAFKKESDSSRWKTTVKSKLHRASFLMERKLNNNLSIHAGLLLNLLQTKYYLNDVPTSPNMLVPMMEETDNRLVIIKPLYTIYNNSAPDVPTSRQLWIGMQAGVIYRLNF